MIHDSTKVLMGTTRSSCKEGVTSYEPASGLTIADFPAGTACRLNSSGKIALAKAAGELVGISLGVDLGQRSRVVVLTAGLKVPMLITEDFVPTLGQPVWVDDVSGLAQDEEDSEAEPAIVSTITSGIYASGVLTGVTEAGLEVDCVLVDMIGGL